MLEPVWSLFGAPQLAAGFWVPDRADAYPGGKDAKDLENDQDPFAVPYGARCRRIGGRVTIRKVEEPMRYDNDAKQMKFEVLLRVAQLAYAGDLEEKSDSIPYDIIPGEGGAFSLLCLPGAGNSERTRDFGERKAPAYQSGWLGHRDGASGGL